MPLHVVHVHHPAVGEVSGDVVLCAIGACPAPLPARRFGALLFALRPPLPAEDAGGPVLTPSGGTAESPQVDAARGEIAAIEGP